VFPLSNVGTDEGREKNGENKGIKGPEYYVKKQNSSVTEQKDDCGVQSFSNNGQLSQSKSPGEENDAMWSTATFSAATSCPGKEVSALVLSPFDSLDMALEESKSLQPFEFSAQDQLFPRSPSITQASSWPNKSSSKDMDTASPFNGFSIEDNSEWTSFAQDSPQVSFQSKADSTILQQQPKQWQKGSTSPSPIAQGEGS
jgi:hypothetical protein